MAGCDEYSYFETLESVQLCHRHDLKPTVFYCSPASDSTKQVFTEVKETKKATVGAAANPRNSSSNVKTCFVIIIVMLKLGVADM